MSDEELQRLRRIAAKEPTIENLAKLGMAYLRATTPKTSILLDGRRWFNRGPGNTYHSVDIYVDGELIGNTGIHYGYGDQYIITGLEQLEVLRPDIPKRLEHRNGSSEVHWQWAERNNIDFKYTVTDVRRKRDL